MDADHVGVELERSQRLLLGPTHPAHAHAEPLRRRLQRGGGVPVEAKAQTKDVPLQAGQALDRVANRS